ncbi:MAG: ABC transporter permease, partial [Gemmatimonadota bacterium]
MTPSPRRASPTHWRVELSRPAVHALRSLPRDEQRHVARRIRRLEREGPQAPEASAAAYPMEITAGEQALACIVDAEARTLVVVTMRPAEVSAGRATAWLARRWMGRWVRRWIDFERGGVGMGGTLQDLGYALRALRRAPGFAMVAVLTLALGIGAATAIFSVADGVLLTPLPYGRPQGVVDIYASWDNYKDRTWVAEDEFQLWHQESRTVEDAALYYRGSATFTDVDNPERVSGASVTPNLFSVLEVDPAVGRTFTWDEARRPDPPIMLSWDVWQRRYGGDRAIVGQTVELDGALRTVVGVLPRGFALPQDFGSNSVTDVYEPYYVDLESPAPDLGGGGSHGAFVVGRLRDGATVAQAQRDLQEVQARVPAVGLYSRERHFMPRVYAARDDVIGSARTTIWLLLGTVAFVLLIACGNVANLLLSRAEARSGEMAVRSALGAGRVRIVRQLLVESGVLALVGGALGLGLAGVGIRVLLAIDPDAVPRAASVSMNGAVILFALGVSLLTALLFGAVPALRVARGGEARRLRERRPGAGTGRSAHRTQSLLVAAQMAMAVILLTGAGLMGRTFAKLLAVDPGFAPENVLTLRMTVPPATYPEAGDVVGFYRELLRRVREIPGVRTAGAARILPLASTMGDAGFRVEGYEPAPDESMQAEWQWVTPGYLEAMRVPLLEGRTFDERDGPGAAGVIIINKALADRYFQGRDPIGKHMVAYRDTATVVGVVGNVAHNGITAARRYRYYRPHAQLDGTTGPRPSRSMTLTIETEGDPRSVLAPVRGVIRALDPSIPVSQVQTMDEVLATALAPQRFALVLLAVFAAIALTLALVGIYGVLA